MESVFDPSGARCPCAADEIDAAAESAVPPSATYLISSRLVVGQSAYLRNLTMDGCGAGRDFGLPPGVSDSPWCLSFGEDYTIPLPGRRRHLGAGGWGSYSTSNQRVVGARATGDSKRLVRVYSQFIVLVQSLNEDQERQNVVQFEVGKGGSFLTLEGCVLRPRSGDAAIPYIHNDREAAGSTRADNETPAVVLRDCFIDADAEGFNYRRLFDDVDPTQPLPFPYSIEKCDLRGNVPLRDSAAKAWSSR